MHEVWEGIRWLLGVGAEPKNINFLQMAIRVIVMYVAGITMMRLAGDRRFGGRYTDFDVIISIAFGSLLSRGINGSGPFWLTVGAGFVFVGMNRLLAFLSRQSTPFSKLVTGNPVILIQDGEIQTANLGKAHITQRDLMASVRTYAHLSDASEVKVARFERNGQISVIPAARKPQIVEVTVEEGVQTVRLQLDYPAEGQRY
jgi:uncharacterized membrane protein YcaP (DUF421 family)